MRIFMMAGAFLLINSSTLTDLVGIGVFLIILLYEKFISKKEHKII